MVWERYTADFSEIIPSESKTLRDENFFKKNKVGKLLFCVLQPELIVMFYYHDFLMLQK